MNKYLTFRYPLDQMAAIIALIFASPILFVAAVMVKLDGGPVFFLQDRCGVDGRVFKIIKLRTMLVDADKYLDKTGMPTRKRTTRIGGFLRKSSLDEIPQLINIIKGDMAIIGPRPILPAMEPYMTPRERGRFKVRPGVSGLAQVRGRNNLKWSRRFKFDVIYSRRANIRLDVYILIQTALLVLKGSDIAQDINRDKVDDIRNRHVS